ncbi:putative HhH-GPD base excision DNA repair family protein [Hibiscus syriacus]|uniref:HhH-GPD base excision DNA repair family protein n=1 Tax=Hibiscus syriacus TaxID=106335 RepID=A0A6A2YSN9_HIBSY|nr:putative HhH-GPD base excision DNA repair family protein [Hibiscus syriacus]
MASLYCNNRGRDSCFTNARYGRSRSKAQACLEKILHLISTVPPPSENDTEPFKKRGFDIDLNLRLGSFLDDGDESEEKSSNCLAENSFNEEKTGTATATDASSDVTDIQKSEEFKSGTGGDVKTAAAFNGSLDLLIEAAEMIASRDYYMNGKEDEVEEVEKSGGGGGSMERDKDSSLNVEEEEFEETENTAPPVVRSKRGRSQVLPLRYRDSVLEPWMKRTQRSTSAAVISKKKRKPR